MRNKARFAGAALAALLAVSAMPLTAFATEGVPVDGAQIEESAGGQASGPAGAMEVDKEIRVKGLAEGDVVKFYQIVKWSNDLESNGWVPADAFSSVLTEADMAGIQGGKDENGKPVAGSVSFELAGRLASIVSGLEPVGTVTSANGESVMTEPAAGLYMGIIIPGAPGTVYNPVFVAADFSQTNNTGGLDLSDGALGYGPNGKAKVNHIGVDKTAVSEDATEDNDGSDTVDIGEKLTFTVTTTVPLYAANYTGPVFKVTDALSEGLELVMDGEGVPAVYAAGQDGADDVLIDASAYTLTMEATGYVVDFKEEYLRGMDAPQPIKIVYQAVVTTDAPFSVNPEDNTVTVNFSNTPDDEVGLGALRDRTNHYTFDIDGTLFGQDGYTNSELVKIGVDADGTEIMDQVQVDNEKWIAALEGAEFELFTDEACENHYSNTTIEAGQKFVSDGNGHIAIRGLDAGTYWLKETKAPDGYIAAEGAVKIEISVVMKTVTVTENVDVNGTAVPVTYETEVLESYQIKINGKLTGSYVMVYENEQNATGVTPGEGAGGAHGDIAGNDENGGSDPEGPGKIVNKIGVALPSTGGIGTTIFYVTGAVLVLGAGVALVAKKRMSGRDDED